MATELVGTFRHKAFELSSARSVPGNDVKLKGGVTTNFPATGDKVMPAGAVVVKKTADGLYYLADDGVNGDRNAAAAIESLEKPDADWKEKTITWAVTYPNGVTVGGDVTLGTADDSIAEVVTALNADSAFHAHCVASDSGAGDLLVITTRAKGNVTLAVSSDLATAYGDGVTLTDEGTEADYRVVAEQRSLVSAGGASRDSDPVPTLLAGHFDESELTGLTDEAKATLLARGSLFA